MEFEAKKIIYNIITDLKSSALEKYTKIKELFPNYLDIVDEKKVIYEKVEGIFHDGLGTYYEQLLFDEINSFYGMKLDEIDKTATIKKMNHGLELYKIFFPNNEYNVDYSKEIENIEKGAILSLEIIKEKVGDKKIVNLVDSAQDYSNGNARDLFIILESGEELNFSLKTDKSGKVAISEGQTSKIFEKVYNRFLNLSNENYENLKLKLFKTIDEKEIFEDFQNIALLTQIVLMEQFALRNVEINDFKNAEITNLENLKYFISQLKFYKNGRDNAFVLLVNRLTGEVGLESILDDIHDVDLDNFSFTPTSPKKYLYSTEPSIKYKGKTFVSFQIKHKRGKYSSLKFQDITIRLRAK